MASALIVESQLHLFNRISLVLSAEVLPIVRLFLMLFGGRILMISRQEIFLFAIHFPLTLESLQLDTWMMLKWRLVGYSFTIYRDYYQKVTNNTCLCRLIRFVTWLPSIEFFVGQW